LLPVQAVTTETTCHIPGRGTLSLIKNPFEPQIDGTMRGDRVIEKNGGICPRR